MAPSVRTGCCKPGIGCGAQAMQRAPCRSTSSLGSPAVFSRVVTVAVKLSCRLTKARWPGPGLSLALAPAPAGNDTSAQRQALAQPTRCTRPVRRGLVGWSSACNSPSTPDSISAMAPSGTTIPAIDSNWPAIIVSASGSGTCQWPRPRKIG